MMVMQKPWCIYSTKVVTLNIFPIFFRTFQSAAAGPVKLPFSAFFRVATDVNPPGETAVRPRATSFILFLFFFRHFLFIPALFNGLSLLSKVSGKSAVKSSKIPTSLLSIPVTQ
jgi:hypothetical protein